jgi:hypothetical protein
MSPQLRQILFSVVLPIVILSKFSAPERLGPVGALILAVSFPFFYGLWDLIREKKWNPVAILGLIGVLLNGGLGLLKLDGIWFAWKEASIPLVIGMAVALSAWTKKPALRVLLLNDAVIDVSKLNDALAQHRAQAEFDQLNRRGTIFLASTFLLSAILNFVLARVLLTSPAGTTEFNEQLARMTGLSLPVIALPCAIATGVVLYWILKEIHRLTGLNFEELLRKPPKPGQPKSQKS